MFSAKAGFKSGLRAFFEAAWSKQLQPSQRTDSITEMKPILYLLPLCVLTLGGCARHYTITLNSGNRITTQGKPKLEHGYYVYKDIKGKPGAVPMGRVREVAPSNMASPRISSGYDSTPLK